jgi:hypothetical protein
MVSVVPSTVKPRSASRGETLTDPETRLRALLDRCWREKVSIKSDYARTNAEIVAMGASLQLITTQVSIGTFAGAWNITTKGLSWLTEKEY